MSDMQASVKRYRRAQASHEWRHQLWTPDSAAELVAYLSAELAEHPGVPLVASRGLDPDGLEVLWFHLKGADHGVNMSHPCPPFDDCGDG